VRVETAISKIYYLSYLEELSMKKYLLIGLIIALVLILVGGAGVVFVKARSLDTKVVVIQKGNQNGDREVPFGYGPGGMMGGYGNRLGPGGMMGGYGPGRMMGGRGINNSLGKNNLHNYMISAFAKAVGLTKDEINAQLSNGKTLAQIANEQGFTGDKLVQLIKDVHKAALDQAVADGVITQAQADNMLERMNNSTNPGFGFGNCPMWDGDETQP
jgi:hypothetical protein